MPSTLTYEITTDDFLEFQKEIMKRVRAEATGVARSRSNFLVFIALVMVILALLIYLPEYIAINLTSFGVALVLLLLLVLPLTVYFQRRIAAMSLPHRDGIVLGPKKMQLDARGVTIQTRGYAVKHTWDAVLDLMETKNLFILRLDTLVGEIIPKEALETCADPEVARALILKRGAV
ncbi:YcxB family protein [Oceanidesulfovibrio marinus]|uniref:YcxB family protein n=1 Tax=Oceanidesulfovibrio marinus TaxID=370038 RepID=A0ABX6NBX0_9BACT|nr:YcxB family protein [Oceanidesulfovibrio marinus]QJT08085.1 YcxB family protein [Oceanidesulfovibrio marinus]